MKKLLITMGALAFILGGCNEGAGDVQEPVGDTFEDSGGSSASDDSGDSGDGESVDLEQGASVYEASCLSCHGDDMQGMNSTPGIEGIAADDVLAAIDEGPGSMPPGLVSGEDAEAVAAYVENGGE
ncbi:hypothetical protein JCM19037_3495 [Geomicrobium sp. JCM 19037]|uniref:c-type cytochrome n=1 Tax=unclassified Geomicrobium TaxID=2628951 RepID=UPI00045F3828|nr:cytochrome c [Geomicrobium sp. JCM 19037]GAK05031.1 hypothetical protein JCM19037_3495 [Geomicrobium sp. JCM 19037]